MENKFQKTTTFFIKEATIKKVSSLLIDLSKKLGEGVYGRVYRGYFEDNPAEYVAVKEIRQEKTREDSRKLEESLMRENETMKILKHDNIVKLYGIKRTVHNIYLATEYCPAGDLESLMSKRVTPFSVIEALTFLKQIVAGLTYSQSQNIIHRDIKPANILLKNGVFKICDFGFARFVNDVFSVLEMTERMGSLNYMAPEVFHAREYNGKCDVWSLGIILYELLYQMKPWSGLTSRVLFKNIKKEELQFYDSESVSVDEEMKDLIRGMLAYEIDKRLDIVGVMKHKVFERDIPDLLQLQLEN